MSCISRRARLAAEISTATALLPAAAQRLPAAPPADALVLFDGRDLRWWHTQAAFDTPAGWR